VTEQQAKQVTPTDQIPFTRGMAATIADTFDALAKHVAATDVRKQAGLVPTPERKLPEGVWVQKFERGWYACKDKSDDGAIRCLYPHGQWSAQYKCWSGDCGHPTESAALSAYWKWHDEQPENAKADGPKHEYLKCPTCEAVWRADWPQVRSMVDCRCRAKSVSISEEEYLGKFKQRPQPAPHPKPYTEATRWACAVSLPHTNDYRIFKGKVQFNPSIIGEQWRDDNDRYTTVESFLSAEQRGEVVRVGEEDHIAEVSKMVPEAHSGTYLAGYAAAESKAGDTIAALQSRVKELEEAGALLARLAYCGANRERLLEMDPTSTHPEVAEDQLRNGLSLIKVMGDVANNPTAKTMLSTARKESPNA